MFMDPHGRLGLGAHAHAEFAMPVIPSQSPTADRTMSTHQDQQALGQPSTAKKPLVNTQIQVGRVGLEPTAKGL
jgi:hypothetical protein